ncbi:MAG: DNA polymerase III subunit delta [Cyanobacteria bacterium CRU_2_1]|nr:DNA polymerase III subunit delta [Cyanobacteria bacterium CRU_2_1]
MYPIRNANLFFWGDDDFAMNRAAIALRDRTLDPDWASFNYDKIPGEQPDAIVQTLNLAMTPPFGSGRRLVWLVETTLCQRCPEELLRELDRTLPVLPDTTVLLLTSTTKPDGRIKSTKLIQKHAEIREFSSIPPWKTDQLLQQVRQAAQEVGVKLTNGAVQLLAESVGNNSRQLYSELEKLSLYADSTPQPLSETIVSTLVATYTQNSLKLATTIRQGDTGKALTLVADLFNRNEPALRIVATLVGQFRTWLWIKLMMEAKERDDRAIAEAAEISNPKRIYFLKQEVQTVSLISLQQSLPLLLELEFGLKQGGEPMALLQTKVIELCQLFKK